jgi:hypothetical protein
MSRQHEGRGYHFYVPGVDLVVRDIEGQERKRELARERQRRRRQRVGS